MTQASLFDVPASRGASRKSDPQTSRDAGRSMTGHLRTQQALVLGCVRDGATAWEVSETLIRHGIRVQQSVCSKRLSELRDLGLVRLTGLTRPGSSSRMQMVHAVTDAGREALR